MVVIHFKRSEKEEFIHDAHVGTSVDELTDQLCTLHNARVRLQCIAKGLEDLAEHGPLRSEAMRGLTTPETISPALSCLSEEERSFECAEPTSSQVLKPDKTGWRCGRAPSADLAAKLHQAVQKIKEALHSGPGGPKVSFTLAEASELELFAKGAVMIVYPGYYGLPCWDPIYVLLEQPQEASKLFTEVDWLSARDSSLWWAKKELTRGKPLSSFIGQNEKTKLVVKIAKRGQGPPLSEPPIDKETHVKMLSFYHRKQEEQKKLEEANEDDYLNSHWADPHALKKNLVTGGRSITFRR